MFTVVLNVNVFTNFFITNSQKKHATTPAIIAYLFFWLLQLTYNHNLLFLQL